MREVHGSGGAAVFFGLLKNLSDTKAESQYVRLRRREGPDQCRVDRKRELTNGAVVDKIELVKTNYWRQYGVET